MINRVRRKFIFWAMTAMTAIVVVLIAAVNIVNWYQTDHRLDAALLEISSDRMENGFSPWDEAPGDSAGTPGTDMPADSSGEPDPDAPGDSADDPNAGSPSDSAGDPNAAEAGDSSGEDFPEGNGMFPGNPPPRPDDGRRSALIQYGGRFFTILLNPDGEINDIFQQQELISQDTAEELLQTIIRKNGYGNDTAGFWSRVNENAETFNSSIDYINEYKYRFKQVRDGIAIFVLDCSTDLQALRSLLLISVLVGAGGILLAFFFILRMSQTAVEPLRISSEKQKQFITNAGHELKTPLTSMSANMEILSMDLGENEWVDSTKRQLGKMKKLVENLTVLSKMEEDDARITAQVCSLSDLAEECADTFAGVAEMQGKAMVTNIEKNLRTKGDPSMIQQLLSILCDNAIKYATDLEPVQIRLYAEGKRILFETVNCWEQNVEKDQLDSLFERFYRGDPARSPENKSSGHGLGLSIAQSLAQKNHAELTVCTDSSDRICFRIRFQKV